MRRSAARSAAGKIEELGISSISPPTTTWRSRDCAEAASTSRPPATATPPMPQPDRRHENIRIHRESVGYDQQPQIPPDHRPLRQEILPGRDAGLQSRGSARGHGGRIDHARAGGHGERQHRSQRRRDFRAARPAAPVASQQQRKRRHSSLASSAAANHATATHCRPRSHPTARRSRAAPPARCCVPRRNRPPPPGSDAPRRWPPRSGRALRQQLAQALVRQQHRAQVKRQIQEVVSQRIVAADLVVHPEREVRERTRLARRPDFDPAARDVRAGSEKMA